MSPQSLYVKVVEAKDLIASDIGGTSDPYIVLRLGNRQKKTTVKKAVLSPTWNEEFVFDVEHEYSTSIRIECYDSDRFTKDDLLGVATFNLPTVEDQLNDVWVDLAQQNGAPLSKPSKVRLQVKVASSRASLLDNGVELLSWEEASDKLKTGDIVVWCEQGNNIFLTLQRTLQGSNWVHSGIVVRQEDAAYTTGTTPPEPILYFHATRRGIQCNPLRRYIERKELTVAVRRLQNVEVSKEMVQKLKELMVEVRDTPYEKSKLQLLKSVYDGLLGHNEKDLSSLFCSELLAESYIRMGLLPDDPKRPSNEYTPRDFSSDAPAESLPLQHGAKLSKEIILTISSTAPPAL